MATGPKISELRALTSQDLQARLQQAQRQLWDLRIKTGAGALRQVHQIRAARRQVAWIKTLIREPQAPTATAKSAGAA